MIVFPLAKVYKKSKIDIDLFPEQLIKRKQKRIIRDNN